MNYTTLIFYKYAHVARPKDLVTAVYGYCLQEGIRGRILISEEGINGTIAATEAASGQFQQFLRAFSAFEDLQFRSTPGGADSFQHPKVKYRRQLLQFGETPVNEPALNAAPHLSPAEFLALKDSPDTVVLDVRNTIEHQVGKFKNALTFDIAHFRDFPQVAAALAPHKEKKILAYCTAGIRCEVATAYLRAQGFNQVFQLEGGILNYSAQTAGYDFLGKCYVFDERQAVDVNFVNPAATAFCKGCGCDTTNVINCANPACNDLTCLCPDCAQTLAGCCSPVCANMPGKRVYLGPGYLKRVGKNKLISISH
jgi:UPF0176 protein